MNKGKATHYGMALGYTRPTRPCRNCPERETCQWRRPNGNACGRFVQSRLDVTLMRAAATGAAVMSVDAAHARQARKRAEELGLKVEVLTASDRIAGLSAGQVFFDELYQMGKEAKDESGSPR